MPTQALRGAADSMGIITTFYFQTQQAPRSVVNWVYEIPVVSPSVGSAAFSHIQSFALNASIIDSKIGFGVTPLPTPSSTTIKTLSWIESLADMWSTPLPQPLTGYNAHDNFYAKSIIVPEATPLTPSALLNYFTYISTAGSKFPPLWFSELNLLGGPSSRINNPSTVAANSAYSARNALWVVQHYTTTPSPADGGEQRALDFVNGLNDALGMGFGGYPNYVDPELSAKEAHEKYFSTAVYERLLKIKRAVDPESVFWNPQAVGT
ncbi:MAG: hypothetical protein Q9213_002735 [Squamulea squamosa]